MKRDAIILLGHGCRARKPSLGGVCAWLKAMTRGRYGVYDAYLSLELPNLADRAVDIEAAGYSQGWVVPMFVVKGRHLTHDVPLELARARAQPASLRLTLCGHLGADEGIGALALLRFKQQRRVSGGLKERREGN